ncbi:MAG: hypothetical protein FJY58_08485 [Betaproteobacteria bacterium]|nr:hypothetical protein [Betaproteobacteria bacterium]
MLVRLDTSIAKFDETAIFEISDRFLIKVAPYFFAPHLAPHLAFAPHFDADLLLLGPHFDLHFAPHAAAPKLAIAKTEETAIADSKERFFINSPVGLINTSGTTTSY